MFNYAKCAPPKQKLNLPPEQSLTVAPPPVPSSKRELARVAINTCFEDFWNKSPSVNVAIVSFYLKEEIPQAEWNKRTQPSVFLNFCRKGLEAFLNKIPSSEKSFQPPVSVGGFSILYPKGKGGNRQILKGLTLPSRFLCFKKILEDLQISVMFHLQNGYSHFKGGYLKFDYFKKKFRGFADFGDVSSPKWLFSL